MNLKGRIARLEKASPPEKEDPRRRRKVWALVWGFWQGALKPYPEALAAVRRNVEGNEQSFAEQTGRFWLSVRDFPEALRHALLATEVLKRCLKGECVPQDVLGPVLGQLERQYAGVSTAELIMLVLWRSFARVVRARQ